MKQVVVNKDQCRKIAEVVGQFKFRKDFAGREYLTMDVPQETKLRTFLFSWSICHQTHTLISKERNLKGWEYIEKVYTNLAKTDSDFIKPEFLATQSVSQISNELKKLFSEAGECTLDRLSERAGFLKDIAEVLNRDYQGRIQNLVDKSNGYVLNNGSGLYELLDSFKAFRDPYKKKSTGFIKEMLDSGIIKQNFIKDWQSLIPIIDYHMQRVLLRTGCIEVRDHDLKRKLIAKEKILSDELVRVPAIEAMRLMAKESGTPVLDMDNLFWSFGRSCCNLNPKCVSKSCSKKPCTFTKVVFAGLHQNCPFENICKGGKSEEYRKFWQPQVDTIYY